MLLLREHTFLSVRNRCKRAKGCRLQLEARANDPAELYIHVYFTYTVHMGEYIARAKVIKFAC